ncbi:MAG: hypothetical protein AAF670_14630 [Planctomycetota bacterium]
MPRQRPITAADIISGLGFLACLMTAIALLKLEGEFSEHGDILENALVLALLQFLTLIIGGLIGGTTCAIGLPMALHKIVTDESPYRYLAVVGAIAGPTVLLMTTYCIYMH